MQIANYKNSRREVIVDTENSLLFLLLKCAKRGGTDAGVGGTPTLQTHSDFLWWSPSEAQNWCHSQALPRLNPPREKCRVVVCLKRFKVIRGAGNENPKGLVARISFIVKSYTKTIARNPKHPRWKWECIICNTEGKRTHIPCWLGF